MFSEIPMERHRAKIKRAVRRARAVQAVFKMIARGGIGSLTTAAIAREAGISEANL